MKRLMVICEPETEYARRLMEYINRRKSFPLRAAAFDSYEGAAEFIKRNETDVFLISEKFWDEKVKDLNVKKIIILTEDENVETGDLKSVYKYLSGDSVLREVESAYDAEIKAVGGTISGKRSGKVYSVYSPVGGSGSTSFVLTLGQELAREHRVLYLNMENCSALEKILGVGKERNISDLIYCARQTPEELMERFPEMTVNIQNLDCVMPASGFDDVSGIRSEEWINILNRISAESRYDIILIEPADTMQGFVGLLEYCNGIFMPCRSDVISQAKIENYERMLTDCGAEEVIEKTWKVKVPFFNTSGLGRSYYEGLLWSELGDCVRQLIRKENIA